MTGALAGVRVLDLSRVLAGPYCSMMLGDLGADVIKVERPGVGDDTRHWGPPFAAPGESAYFLCVNRNKRSIAVDLKMPEGVEIIKDLAGKSDVLLENFAPGAAEKLGIGYETIRDLNQRIVYCSITGFGSDGPYSHRTGYDLAVSALGGLMGITGEPDGPPVKVGVAITDVCTGIAAQGAICAALYAREKTGRGQRIDLSLLETQVAALVNMASSYLISGQVPHRWGTAHESIVPYQAFDTADKYLIVAIGNDQQWRKFCHVLGMPELADDVRFRSNPLRVEHRTECIGIIAPVMKTRKRDEWIALLNAEAIPCAPINSMDEVFVDPQVLHRGMLVEVDHPAAGRVKLVGVPVKYSETEATVRRPPPRLGEHTEEVLVEVLGYDQARTERLKARGVISGLEGRRALGGDTGIARASGSAWKVEFDGGTCSICEMCVNRCPWHALFIRREGTIEEILFDYRLCDGCAGQAYCEAHCPEKAVIVSRVARECMPAEPTVLIRGEMTTCQSCGALFIPERKLETLLSKEKIRPKSVQRYCPACRRDHLLESVLSERGHA